MMDKLKITLKEYTYDKVIVHDERHIMNKSNTIEKRKEKIMEILDEYDWNAEILIKIQHNLSYHEYINDV